MVLKEIVSYRLPSSLEGPSNKKKKKRSSTARLFFSLALLIEEGRRRRRPKLGAIFFITDID